MILRVLLSSTDHKQVQQFIADAPSINSFTNRLEERRIGLLGRRTYGFYKSCRLQEWRIKKQVHCIRHETTMPGAAAPGK